MAASRRSSESLSFGGDLYTLHEMFRIIGDQLTQKDIRTLKSMYNHVFSSDVLSKIKDGYSVFLALEKLNWVDDTNFKHVMEMLKCVTRHDLVHLVTLRKPRPAQIDPVDEYLESTATSSTIVPFKRSRQDSDMSSGSGQASMSGHGSSTNSSSSFSEPSTSSSSSSQPLPSRQQVQLQSTSTSNLPASSKRRKTRFSQRKGKRRSDKIPTSDNQPETATQTEIKKKVTCDIRLRVRAEYCQHDSALEGNVQSNKPHLVERQFEKFLQANTILKSRDLGSIICDIKFSELTYLDAFWRDYINGALLEALKGVFITESLKQAVGHEAIKLLVNVDEDDYEKGRLKLLENLTD